MPYSINQAELLIDKLLLHYNVSTYSDLALKLDTTQANISSWKIRNSINAIKNKCKELGIYNEIFGDLNLSSNKSKKEDKSNIDLAKYFKALQSVAIATSKEDELVEDIKNLMIKYIGENK
ncbi:hypothetical protein [Aliarcobacter skirrowii]|uniref:hypothetical protein n=1 Tax=Aliarcobacter skirrowii TaxID=28200 RepID=UPI0008377821|nr:hypothetical protein [Aliarcobacter skirrowii]